MKLRLAFSVAAHLEPEILLIDEVLAVGDAEFQKKCLGKMNEVSKSGRTVLFVSHNLGAVRQLCKRGILLNNAQVLHHGEINKVLERYHQSTLQNSEINLNNIPRSGKGDLRIERIYFTNFNEEVLQTQLVSGSDIILNVAYRTIPNISLKSIDFGISIYDQENRFITVLNNTMANFHFKEIPNNGIMKCKLEKLPLTFGNFNTSFSLNANGILMDRIENAFSFSVLEGDYYNSNFSNCHSRTGVYIEQSWEIDS
jgi:lipopolysaccharide transport system ATP-binding protein